MKEQGFKLKSIKVRKLVVQSPYCPFDVKIPLSHTRLVNKQEYV